VFWPTHYSDVGLLIGAACGIALTDAIVGADIGDMFVPLGWGFGIGAAIGWLVGDRFDQPV
jgi:hypothetical protein